MWGPKKDDGTVVNEFLRTKACGGRKQRCQRWCRFVGVANWE